MRQILPVFSLFMFLIAGKCAFSQTLSEEHFENTSWSGTVTYSYRTTSKHAGAYSEYIYKDNSVDSDLRMSAAINKGKGATTTFYSYKSISKRKELVAGKTYQYEEIESGSANGNTISEIEIMYDEENRTYSFTIPTPAATGTMTLSRSCEGCGTADPSPSSRPMGQEESMIMVEDQKLGKNPDILTGEIIDKDVNEQGDITETVIRWSLHRGQVDVELLVFPQDYKTWLPVPGKNEDSHGNKIDIAMKLQKKGGGEPRFKVKSFELRLLNTSKEPGVAINYPLAASANPLPDLRFLTIGKGELSAEGQVLRLESANGRDGQASIAAYDGGGYTVLEVEAVLEGGLRVTGHLETVQGPTQIEIPYRVNGGKIAAVWLAANGNPAEKQDDEITPGNNNNGDGLTAYEEYRGIFSEGKFKRLDPSKKELGVQMEKSVDEEAAQGLAMFTRSTNLVVVKLRQDELGEDRIFNKNSASKAGVQYALRLLNRTLPKGVIGVNEPMAESGKTPKQSIQTIIDLAQIRVSYEQQKQAYADSGVKIIYTLDELIASTLAHELSHGVNVTHHGESSNEISRTIEKVTKNPFHIYGENGLLIEKRPYTFTGKVGTISNDASGDVGCYMTYNAAYQWSYQMGEGKANIYRAVPQMHEGDHLCTSAKGTGINADNQYFGDATWGDCVSKVKVKDY